ncbi:MAG: hypothetical protein Q8P76_03615 [bacterium]|nr:hypothetical protein [bacterium]
MKRVILESPFAGEVERNIQYARLCLRDCLKRGEAPIASHLLYTQPGVLDDDQPEERRLGIEAGLVWGSLAEMTVVYADFGISKGMQYGIDHAKQEARPVEIRYLSIDVVMNLAKRFAMTICDGCNVNAPFEHRCHGDRAFINGERKPFKSCECPICREQERIINQK